MQNVPFIKRIIYYYVAIMLRLIHWTDTHKLLGLRFSSLIKVFALVLPVAAWMAGWPRILLILAAFFLLWIYISYWRARRTGYYRFVANKIELMAASEIEPLLNNDRIKLRASGIFSLKDWERTVVLRSAEYWQVPLGDHAIMVEHEPGRYLYQFFNANTMQELKSGWLLYGTHPHPAIAIKFLSTWGPEFSEDTVSLLRGNNDSKPVKIRTIHLSFDNEETEKSVWQNLVFDARRARSGQSHY